MSLVNNSIPKNNEFSDVFFLNIKKEMISKGDTDPELQQSLEKIILDIQTTKNPSTAQTFLETIDLIQDSYLKGETLEKAFNVFSKILELQGAALIALKKDDEKYKDSYLSNLIEECRITKNKIVAIEAVNEMNDLTKKDAYLNKINNQHNFFK